MPSKDGDEEPTIYSASPNSPPKTPVGLVAVFPFAAALYAATVRSAVGFTAATMPLGQWAPTEQ